MLVWKEYKHELLITRKSIIWRVLEFGYKFLQICYIFNSIPNMGWAYYSICDSSEL
jgi:hypothetical protein